MTTKGNVFRQLEPIRGLSEIRLTELANLCRPETFRLVPIRYGQRQKTANFFT
ncbi:MAG: hypothetical protein IPJ38_08005 [Dechloromonas sp.]|uniref:Uncharacterized protein n=1 Tax=Candidatus Dechloromonas phosphorivorans TaxID=2899244 RepID=A0A935MVU0_9RHOO|nr:hypothetical protein [Candidatus Dechloromonas phosphorivorans]